MVIAFIAFKAPGTCACAWAIGLVRKWMSECVSDTCAVTHVQNSRPGRDKRELRDCAILLHAIVRSLTMWSLITSSSLWSRHDMPSNRRKPELMVFFLIIILYHDRLKKETGIGSAGQLSLNVSLFYASFLDLMMALGVSTGDYYTFSMTITSSFA